MATLVPLVIVAWPVVAYVLFRRLPGFAAALLVVIAGQMFLPEVYPDATETGAPAALSLPLIKFTKANVIGYALLVGSLTADWRRWKYVVPRWYDLPMAAWCVSPFVPSVINGASLDAGLYEGASLTLHQTMAWGVPYWCGRLYLGDWFGLRAAAAAIVLGGIVYAPLCLIELRISPQLHRWLYGYHQHEFVQTMRDGGFRPMVFMEHGLMVALWMAAAALTAFWLWHEGAFRVVGLHPRLPAIGLGWVALGLAGMTVLLHSTGATVLGAAGAGALYVARRYRTAVPLIILALLPPAYAFARYSEIWDGQDLVNLAREFAGPERAESLDFRFSNEYKLLQRAKEQPLFGWGDSGAARVVENADREKVVTDSMWIIVVGNRGLVGLMSFLAALLTPVLLIYFAPGDRYAPAAVLAVVLNLYLLDHMVNAMVNPVFAIVAGALTGFATLRPEPFQEW
jgi:hypothetical protein